MSKIDKYLGEATTTEDAIKQFEMIGNEYIRIGKLIVQGAKKKEIGTLSNMDMQLAKNKSRWDKAIKGQ